MRKKGLFVTGTDTEVGKTFVTSALAAWFKRKTIDVGVFKPMMSGAKREAPTSDVLILKKMSGDTSSLETINPFQFDEPLAPYMAAKRQGKRVSLSDILQTWESVKHQHKFFFVEGAGGLAVPFGDDYLVADVAKSMGFPLLIVARPDLGTVNHTLLTMKYARSIGLEIAGVILNGLKKDKQGIAEQTNPELIEEFSNVPVLGVIPWIERITREDLIQVIDRHVSIETLFNLLDSKK